MMICEKISTLFLCLICGHISSCWSQLFSYGSGATLPPNDDDFSNQITMGTAFPYFGVDQTRLYVCTNGIISFGAGIDSYEITPFPIADNPVVAPFWADVDTRSSGTIYYRELTGASLTEVSDAVNAADAEAGFSATWGFLATWHEVPPYNRGSQQNTFQAAIATDGVSSYVVYNYGPMHWTYGSASNGVPGQVGFDAGDQTNSYAHPDSRTSAIGDIELGSNVGVTGRYIYKVDEGDIVTVDGHCSCSPCQNGGSCTDATDSYTCACAAGFQGTSCESEIDECQSDPCQNEATCVDDVNAFTCTCAPGYEGTTCDTDIDECASDPCANGATCIDAVDGYTCSCAAGYSGENCETDVDECVSDPCANGATCEDGVNGFTCACVDEFTGTNCETDIDACQSNPCQHDATCSDQTVAYECACAAGYTGLDCETNIDECAHAQCENGATCQDGVAEYTCQCVPGYTGTECESEIDECASEAACENGATCIDQLNGYSCECVAGFEGDNCELGACELYLNASDREPYCRNNGSCINSVTSATNGSLVGEATCECSSDYEGDQCEDEIRSSSNSDLLRDIWRGVRRIPWLSRTAIATMAGVAGLLSIAAVASCLLWLLCKRKKQDDDEEEETGPRNHDNLTVDDVSAAETSSTSVPHSPNSPTWSLPGVEAPHDRDWFC